MGVLFIPTNRGGRGLFGGLRASVQLGHGLRLGKPLNRGRGDVIDENRVEDRVEELLDVGVWHEGEVFTLFVQTRNTE